MDIPLFLCPIDIDTLHQLVYFSYLELEDSYLILDRIDVPDNKTSDIIRMKNMTFYAHHGYYEAERELGQKFEVDIEIHSRQHFSADADDLQRTVDYREVYRITREIFENYKFKLIETVASRIAEKMLVLPGITDVLVRVRKPHVPLNGLLDHVEVEIFREGQH